jgi:hypothetical protein
MVLLSLPDLRSGKWIVKMVLRLSIFRRLSILAKDVVIEPPYHQTATMTKATASKPID